MNERAQNTERSEAKVLVDGERLVAYAFVRYYCGEVRASGTDLETLRALTLTNCVASELWSEQHARTARDAGNRKNLRGRRLKILTGINRVKSVGMQGQPLPMTKALSLLNRLLPLRTSSEIVKFELTSLQPADKVGSSGEHFQCTYSCTMRLWLTGLETFCECAAEATFVDERLRAIVVAKKCAKVRHSIVVNRSEITRCVRRRRRY
jgi:hypothetical protein